MVAVDKLVIDVEVHTEQFKSVLEALEDLVIAGDEIESVLIAERFGVNDTCLSRWQRAKLKTQRLYGTDFFIVQDASLKNSHWKLAWFHLKRAVGIHR